MTQTLQWVVRGWTDLENSIVSVERMQDYAHAAKEVTGQLDTAGGAGPGLQRPLESAPFSLSLALQP